MSIWHIGYSSIQHSISILQLKQKIQVITKYSVKIVLTVASYYTVTEQTFYFARCICSLNGPPSPHQKSETLLGQLDEFGEATSL